MAAMAHTSLRVLHSLLVVLLCCAALALPDHARADGVADEADLQFRLGAQSYRDGRYEEALAHFLASNRLVQNRNVVFNIARTFDRLGRFADAYRYYVDALAAETDADTQRDMRDALRRLADNVAVVEVETNPPGASIYVDRRDLGSIGTAPRPIALAAGRYKVIVELEGYESAELEIEARVGQTVPARFELRRIVGHVRIEGETGAAVYVDDETSASVCTTPCEVDLAPGQHTLYFVREGYQIFPRQLNVVARETVTVRASLTALTGSIVVSADERDALIEVDDRPVGFTPAVIPNVPAGRRRVRISLPGYETVEREVVVVANEQADLRNLRLRAVREVTAASRLTESLEDAPSSVSIITPQELQAFQYPTIFEALRGVRGMALSYDSVYASVAIRGIGQPNDYGNRLLVLQDGATLNDNLLFSSYIGYDGRADLGDIERIEIVRGPGSVLYGTNALSGVVNLVPRREGPTGGQVGVSTYADGITRARARMQLNLGRNAGAWASVSGARSDGHRLEVELPGEEAGTVSLENLRGVDSFWAGTFTGRAWYGPVTAQWLYTTREQNIPAGTQGTDRGDPRTEFVDTRVMVELRAEPKLSDELQLFTRVHANHYSFGGNYLYEGLPSVENYYGSWFGGEARAVWRPSDKVRVSVGGELQLNTTVELEGYNVDDMGAREPYLNVGTDAPDAVDADYTIGAFYALVEARVARWLRVSGGARIDLYSDIDPSLNPRLALIFRLTSKDTVKVLGGRAFRAPSVYERTYTDGVSQIPPTTPLVPEAVYSGELEYTHRFDDDLSATASGFLNYLDNLVESVSSDPTNPDAPEVYRNATSTIITTGGDIEVRREWRQGWMLSAMYGFLLSQYTADPEGGNGDRRTTNAPEHFASFKLAVPLMRSMTAASRVTLEGPRRINLGADDTTDAAVVADLVISGNVPAFGLRYAAGIYNVFNWEYSVPVAGAFDFPTVPQAGRTFMLSASATF